MLARQDHPQTLNRLHRCQSHLVVRVSTGRRTCRLTQALILQMQPTLPHAGVQHEPTVPQTPRSVKEKFCQFIHTAEHVFRKSGIFIPEDWELWQFAVIAALCFSTAVVVLYLSTRLGRPTHFSPSAPRLGYQSGPSNRGTISIVSSCLLTIYSCTYAVFHSDPVLSSSQETEGKLHMWFIAIASLLIPEYLLTTSVDQLSKAWKFNTMMKKTGFRDWNMAMSFLAISNAFTEQPDGTDQLNETSIREHIEDKRRMNPSVAIDYDYIKFEIRSRSKQDSLGKLLATLQVLRLGVQTVTRWAAGLSVTPLELVTCGYVFLAAGTYIAWWSKPYSLRGTVWLKLSGVEVEARPREEHGIQEVNVIGRDDQGQLLPVTAEKGSELPDQSGAICKHMPHLSQSHSLTGHVSCSHQEGAISFVFLFGLLCYSYRCVEC